MDMVYDTMNLELSMTRDDSNGNTEIYTVSKHYIKSKGRKLQFY
jgi:hypothetical protein